MVDAYFSNFIGELLSKIWVSRTYIIYVSTSKYWPTEGLLDKLGLVSGGAYFLADEFY